MVISGKWFEDWKLCNVDDGGGGGVELPDPDDVASSMAESEAQNGDQATDGGTVPDSQEIVDPGAAGGATGADGGGDSWEFELDYDGNPVKLTDRNDAAELIRRGIMLSQYAEQQRQTTQNQGNTVQPSSGDDEPTDPVQQAIAEARSAREQVEQMKADAQKQADAMRLQSDLAKAIQGNEFVKANPEMSDMVMRQTLAELMLPGSSASPQKAMENVTSQWSQVMDAQKKKYVQGKIVAAQTSGEAAGGAAPAGGPVKLDGKALFDGRVQAAALEALKNIN